MKIVITGGCGFIGSNLAEYLREESIHNEIVLYDLALPRIKLSRNLKYVYGDVRDINSLIKVFNEVDEVYHLAGVLGTSELNFNVQHALEVNIKGTANVFEACIAAEVRRVYNATKPSFISSHENMYTLTKVTGENLGWFYRRKGLSIATLRWMNAIGPYQHLYPVRKFIPISLLYLLNGNAIEIYGSGNQTIDPIHVKDVCRATVYACRNLGSTKKIFDLGSGNALSCNRVAEIMRELFTGDFNLSAREVTHTSMRDGEVETKLKADMSDWGDIIDLRLFFSFERQVIDCLKCICALPLYEVENALMFFGKVPHKNLKGTIAYVGGCVSGY